MTDSTFFRMLGLMQSDDLSALALGVPRDRTDKRQLPPYYSEDTDQLFKQLFQALDFPSALRLITPQDLAASARPAEAGGHRILVVDDAPVTVRVLCSTLKDVANLRFALSAEHALEIALVWQPEIVISDVNLDGMSGIDLCRQLKQRPQTADCVTLLISADDSLENEIAGLTAGAADFIEKPLSPARVLGRVNSQLNAIKSRIGSDALSNGAIHFESTGFITCDLAGIVNEINPSVTHLMGITDAAYRGKKFTDLVDAASAQTIEEAFLGFASSGKFGPLEVRLRCVGGAMLPVRLVGRRIGSKAAEALWIGVEDLTARLLNERKRFDMHVSRTVGSITAGIAHEYNNLLGIVIGNIDVALDLAPPNEAVTKALNRAIDAAMRGAEISRRLNDSVAYRTKPLGAPEVLETLIDQMWPVLRNVVPERIELVREFSAETLRVSLDSEQLRMALTRVIDNACEAMPEGGRILIRTGLENVFLSEGLRSKFAVIEVTDSGCGMDEATRERAFDPFFTTKYPKHTGLGLSQVMAFTTRYLGSTEIMSTPGARTTVRLKLPITD